MRADVPPRALTKAMELRRRREAERDAYLLAQLEASETVVASGPQALVTNARILIAWGLLGTRPDALWTHDALTFEEIERWSIGRMHDHRPLLRVEHPPHGRIAGVPAHPVLGFRPEDIERETPHRDTTFSFRSDRDPVFRAICQRLGKLDLPQGDPFVVVPPGTREQRMRGSVSELTKRPSRRLRFGRSPR